MKVKIEFDEFTTNAMRKVAKDLDITTLEICLSFQQVITTCIIFALEKGLADELEKFVRDDSLEFTNWSFMLYQKIADKFLEEIKKK